jgi:hypothetical protein
MPHYYMRKDGQSGRFDYSLDQRYVTPMKSEESNLPYTFDSFFSPLKIPGMTYKSKSKI